MALRRLFQCLSVAALVVGLSACKGKGDSKATGLDKRCEQLAKACGDNDKHIEKIVEGCKEVAKQQEEKGCTDKAIAAYDCYEKELCGKADKVWAIEDLRVLADRQKKCVAERDAARECVSKK